MTLQTPQAYIQGSGGRAVTDIPLKRPRLKTSTLQNPPLKRPYLKIP